VSDSCIVTPAIGFPHAETYRFREGALASSPRSGLRGRMMTLCCFAVRSCRSGRLDLPERVNAAAWAVAGFLAGQVG
jgi:hypothetical protein